MSAERLDLPVGWEPTDPLEDYPVGYIINSQSSWWWESLWKIP